MNPPTTGHRNPARAGKRPAGVPGLRDGYLARPLVLDRIATHIPDYRDEGKVEFFEGNFTEYEEYKKRTLGADALEPKRIKYKRIANKTKTATSVAVFMFVPLPVGEGQVRASGRTKSPAHVIPLHLIKLHRKVDIAHQRRRIELTARVGQPEIVSLNAPRRQHLHQRALFDLIFQQECG